MFVPNAHVISCVVNRQRRFAWAFYIWWSRAEEYQNQRLLEKIVCTLNIVTQATEQLCM